VSSERKPKTWPIVKHDYTGTRGRRLQYTQTLNRRTPSGRSVPQTQDRRSFWHDLIVPGPSKPGGRSADPRHPSRKHDTPRPSPVLTPAVDVPGRFVGQARRRDRRAAARQVEKTRRAFERAGLLDDGPVPITVAGQDRPYALLSAQEVADRLATVTDLEEFAALRLEVCHRSKELVRVPDGRTVNLAAAAGQAMTRLGLRDQSHLKRLIESVSATRAARRTPRPAFLGARP
jgi:hypothetical protein